MEMRGLIDRAACPDDARSSVIHLTSAGEEQARAARRALGGAIHRSLAGVLSEDQIAQLAIMTDAVVRHLEQPSTSRS
jgi:DNA-binding MarR family transcriptional regulator